MAQWIVVLEVARDPQGGAAEVRALADALRALTDARASLLHSTDRYAVQLEIGAAGPAEALSAAIARWNDARRALTYLKWDLVRAELLTPEELEADYEAVDDSTFIRPVPVPGDMAAFLAAGDSLGEDLLRRAFLDSLTGLPTRGLFLDGVMEALADAEQQMQAVLFIDLDGFHLVNMRLGAAVGDAVLVAVAQRLSGIVGGGENVARIGADQFAVLLEDTSEVAAGAVAQQIVTRLRDPLDAHATTPVIAASIGIAFGEPGQHAEQVLRNAGAAMCVAKQATRGGWEAFHPGMPEPDPVRLERGADLSPDRVACLLLLKRAAIAANESPTFEDAAQVVLQQVCAHTGWSIGHLFVKADPDSAGLVPSTVWQLTAPTRFAEFKEATEAMPFAAAAGLVNRVVESRRPTWIRDLQADPEFLRARQAADAGLKSSMAFPILVGQEVVGVLEFFGHEETAPSEAFLDVLASVGTQLGRVVERDRAAEALRRAAERFKSLAQSAADAIVSTDARGSIISWNQGAERMFGYREEEALGQTLPMIMPERYRAAHSKGMSRFFLTGKGNVIGRTLHLDGLRRDGTEFPIVLSISTWETAEGRFVTGIVREFSPRPMPTPSDAVGAPVEETEEAT